MSLPERHKKKQTKYAFILSVVFHGVLIGVLFYVAAREGVLGKQMRTLVAVSVPEEKKKPEPQKPKDEPKPVERPKEEAKAAAPVVAPPPGAATAPPPPSESVAAAPPPAIGADFDFNDGAKAVQTSSDPVVLYKGRVEYAFRSRWLKPDDVDDSQFAAEVDVAIRPDGSVAGATWRRGSGNEKWDSSVRDALKNVKEIGGKPPKGYPEHFLVRFDAVAEAAEPVN